MTSISQNPRTVTASSATAPSNAAALRSNTDAAPPSSSAGVAAHLVDFFDPNHSGTITLPETVVGLRRLGIGCAAAVGAGLAINFGLGIKMMVNPFALPIAKMAKGKHVADTDLIDPQGKFDTGRFDEIFRKYGGPNGDRLTAGALARLWRDNVRRDLGIESPVGAVAAIAELGLLFYLGAQTIDGQKVLTKERMHAVYNDPKLFEKISQEQQALRESRNRTLTGKLVNTFHTLVI